MFNHLANAPSGWIYNEESESFESKSIYSLFTFFFQLTHVAAERSAEKRLEFIARIGNYSPEQLVFVDESSVDRRTTYQGRAWSIRGTKAQRKAFFVRASRTTVQPIF